MPIPRSFLTAVACTVLTWSTSTAQPYWLPLERPTTLNLRALFFTDSLRGWTGGDSGIILSTADGGRSWSARAGADSVSVTDIFMLDSLTGWATAIRPLVLPGDWTGSLLYRTDDGGASWTGASFPDVYFNSVFFFDTLNGWVAGEFGLIRGTTDGGNSWFTPEIEPTIYSNFPAKKIRFLTAVYGYAVGGYPESAGVIWRTADGGSSWSVTGLGDALRDVYFFDSLNVFCAGGGFDDGVGVSRSTDGGGSWSFSYTGPFGIATSVAFRDGGEGWSALSFSGTSMASFDSGGTWSEYPNPGNIPLYRVLFAGPRHGYMAGDSGTILAYNPPGIVSVVSRWNLVSVPVDIGTAPKDSLFPSAVSDAYKFTPAGYVREDTLRHGTGYWLKFPTAAAVEIRGLPVIRDTVGVGAGWNMIGGLTSPLPAASVRSVPAGIVSSGFFAYRNGYVSEDTLQPGAGYWVKVDSAGVLILDAFPD